MIVYVILCEIYKHGAYLRALHLPPLGCYKIVLEYNVKKIFVLNFEHFCKCTPEMYPPGTPSPSDF